MGDPYRALDALALEDRLATEEATLSFRDFDRDQAWAMGAWLRDYALEHELGVSIAVDLGEHRVFHAGPFVATDHRS